MNMINYNVMTPRSEGNSNNLLHELLRNETNRGYKFSPTVDIFEEDQLYTIVIAVAGMKKDDIKIEILDNKLQISGQRNIKENKVNRIYHLQGIPHGSFSKSFHVPKTVNLEKIEAVYKDGLLKLLLPKNQKLRQKYQIEVK